MGTFTKEEKSVIFTILIGAIAGILILAFINPKTTTIQAQSSVKQLLVNINQAPAEELVKLPGIGPSYADKIITYRKENGGFKSPEELQKVKGIGSKKYLKIKRFVTVQ
ncbi:MAG: hypothetical protein CVV21_04995 [Candidatus Goldiibacteriota bacterium HGW-Goldbacteria-1]|jgi:comEA protein|nr:MAG: hypothetical protein CVV21_04995 [Candidatus Goldiibacteriota bacterium HGW-Goldbacteria-1]